MRTSRGFIAWFVAVALLIPATTVFAGGAGESEPETQPEQTAVPERAAAAETVEVSVVVPTGVPTIGVSFLASGALPIAVEGYETSFEVVTSPDVMGARLISGEADIAVVPTNLGARLYNQDVPVQLAGVIVWGILYVVSADPVANWDDMRGREIGMLGRGLTPDIVFRHVARENGLDPDSDLTLRYVNASTELAPNFITGAIDLSIMPEPMLTMVLGRSPGAVVAFDLQEEWAAVSDSGRSFPQASLVVSQTLAAEHPEYVAAFIETFADGVARAVENPAEAAQYAAALMPQLPAPVIEAAMPRTNLEFVDAVTARPAVEEYFRVLMEYTPQATGGALPDDGFYYSE